MAQLLVSVRDATEALAAVRGGAALIDLKEPLHGALGAVDPQQAQQIRRAVAEVAPGLPLSLALGELDEAEVCERARAAHGFQFAKVGLAGAARPSSKKNSSPNNNASDTAPSGWRGRWGTVLRSLPNTVRAVAVVYADHQAAESPVPLEIIAQAVQFECAALLVDTFVKDGRSLFDHQTPATVAHWVELAQTQGMLAVLGGSLTLDNIPLAVSLGADFVAVRGAACRGGRSGPLDESRVASLVAIVRTTSTTSGAVRPRPAITS